MIEISRQNSQQIINNDRVNIYDKYFDLDDIDGFIGFYKSKAGQKMLANLPAITKDIVSVLISKYQPQMQEEIMKAIHGMNRDLHSSR